MVKEPKKVKIKGTIFEDAKVVRAVQYVNDGKKNEENLVYSMELHLNGIPIIVTMRVGNDFTEVTVVDKNTGKMLEYLGEQNGKMEVLKAHNFTPEQAKKLFSKPKA